MTPKTLLFTFCLATGLSVSVRASTITSDFETTKTSFFKPIQGDSQIEISTEKAHSGQKSAKVSFDFSGDKAGSLQIREDDLRGVEVDGDTVYFSLWVYGTGKPLFSRARIKIWDSGVDNDFWISVPELAKALNGEGWSEVRATFSLKEVGQHGPDGALDYAFRLPFYWGGMSLTQADAATEKGAFYFDDFSIGDTAPVEATPAE